MSEGQEIVIRVKENGSWIMRPPTGLDDHPDAERRPRSNVKTPIGRADGLAHNPLTVAELIVFLGQRILMGRYWRALLVMFWSGDDGDRVRSGSKAMRKNRHIEIVSHLSFMKPDDSRWPNDKLRKLREVDNILREQVKAAWDIEPNVTIDESRLRLASRFCSFVVTMLCKPIKVGITIYCANLESGYLYDWVWFPGSGQALPPMGQPTDGGTLDEDSMEQVSATLN